MITCYFISSTLPAKFLEKNLKTTEVSLIFASSKSLAGSMSIFTAKPKTFLICLPLSKLFRFLSLLLILIILRIIKGKIIFFHECCDPLLDLLILWTKPRGSFYPQVTMSAYEEIPIQRFPSSHVIQFLKLIKHEKYFKYYMSEPLGGEKREYGVSIKTYPSSIDMNDIDRSLFKSYQRKSAESNKILFLTGTGYCDNEVIKRCYLKVINIALSAGYNCYIKDHPNPSFRLNLEAENCVFLEPSEPSEMLGDDYNFIVGLASTALLQYGDRSISLTELIPELQLSASQKIRQHFSSIDPRNGVKFMREYSELKVAFEAGLKVCTTNPRAWEG